MARFFFGLDALDFIASSSGVWFVEPNQELFTAIAFSGK